MHIVPVTLTLRGHNLDLDVPGNDAPDLERMVAQVEMLVLAMVALEDPRVDAVLTAFGFKLDTVEIVDGREQVVTIFPPGETLSPPGEQG